MPRVRKIKRNPVGKNYYLVDTNFLVNKYLPLKFYTGSLKRIKDEKSRIEKCREWWDEIDRQKKQGKARIYIPDICIAEAFKVLAKKYYIDNIFPNPVNFNDARRKMINEICMSSKMLRTQRRVVKVHDLSTCRDIIIAVDRFFEMFMKKKKDVAIVDLIVLATAKYLMDFFDIPKDNLHIITCDGPLYEGSREITELPIAYNPLNPKDRCSRIFE